MPDKNFILTLLLFVFIFCQIRILIWHLGLFVFFIKIFIWWWKIRVFLEMLLHLKIYLVHKWVVRSLNIFLKWLMVSLAITYLILMMYKIMFSLTKTYLNLKKENLVFFLWLSLSLIIVQRFLKNRDPPLGFKIPKMNLEIFVCFFNIPPFGISPKFSCFFQVMHPLMIVCWMKFQCQNFCFLTKSRSGSKLCGGEGVWVTNDYSV